MRKVENLKPIKNVDGLDIYKIYDFKTETMVEYGDKTPYLPIKVVTHPITKQVYYYKEIPGYKGYGVTKEGKVLSFKSRHIDTSDETNDYELKVKIHSHLMVGARREYRAALLSQNGVQNMEYVHRLVMECWVGLPTEFNPDGTKMKTPPECNHKDLDPVNNDYTNLEWCDRFYNNAHRCPASEWGTTNPVTTDRAKGEHTQQYYENALIKKKYLLDKVLAQNEAIKQGTFETNIKHHKDFYQTREASNNKKIAKLTEEINSITEILSTKYNIKGAA